MVSNKALICVLLVGVFCFAQLTVAATPAQAYGMDVVFKDMGFGLLIGTVMAGLVMGANPNTRSDDWGRGLALGGAAGATVGLGIGMVSTYKTAMINYDREEGLAFNLPLIKSAILADKTTVSVFQYQF